MRDAIEKSQFQSEADVWMLFRYPVGVSAGRTVWDPDLLQPKRTLCRFCQHAVVDEYQADCAHPVTEAARLAASEAVRALGYGFSKLFGLPPSASYLRIESSDNDGHVWNCPAFEPRDPGAVAEYLHDLDRPTLAWLVAGDTDTWESEGGACLRAEG